MVSIKTQKTTLELTVPYFKRSQGKWKSQRRYYMLNQETEPQEVESTLSVRYLDRGAPELIELAQLHESAQLDLFVCGTVVTWSSNYLNQERKASQGSTIFGVAENQMYRDRGFATSKPIVATYWLTNPDTLCLRTEYNNSAFEEEIKLVGQNYRTRQTIISRAEQEITIGQYLETRIK